MKSRKGCRIAKREQRAKNNRHVAKKIKFRKNKPNEIEQMALPE
jgi:hypothetical protein